VRQTLTRPCPTNRNPWRTALEILTGGQTEGLGWSLRPHLEEGMLTKASSAPGPGLLVKEITAPRGEGTKDKLAGLTFMTKLYLSYGCLCCKFKRL
jgi:hypothetical protein